MEVHLSDWRPVLYHRAVRVHGKITKISESTILIAPERTCGSEFESEDIAKCISKKFIIDNKLQLINLTGKLTATEDLPEFIREEFQNGFPIYWYRLICMWIDYKLQKRINTYDLTEPLKLLSLSSLKRNTPNTKNAQNPENNLAQKNKVTFLVNFPYTQSKTIQKNHNYKLATLKNSSVVTSTPIMRVKGASRFAFNEITKKKKTLSAESFEEIFDKELSNLSDNYRRFTENGSLSPSNTTSNENTTDDDDDNSSESDQSSGMVLRKRKHVSTTSSSNVSLKKLKSKKSISSSSSSDKQTKKEKEHLKEKRGRKRKVSSSPIIEINKSIKVASVQNNQSDKINIEFKKPLRPAPKSIRRIFKKPEPKIDESVNNNSNNTTSSTNGTDSISSTINNTSRKEKRKLFHKESHQQNCTNVTF